MRHVLVIAAALFAARQDGEGNCTSIRSPANCKGRRVQAAAGDGSERSITIPKQGP